MALLTYKDARPWAKSIRAAVLTRKMPPWFADPHYGKFSNDRSLSQAEIDTLVGWADTGAAEGDPKDAPAPLQFVDGWNIGTPIWCSRCLPPMRCRGGTVEYQYIVIPTNLTEDKWVQATEIRLATGRCCIT